MGGSGCNHAEMGFQPLNRTTGEQALSIKTLFFVRISAIDLWNIPERKGFLHFRLKNENRPHSRRNRGGLRGLMVICPIF